MKKYIFILLLFILAVPMLIAQGFRHPGPGPGKKLEELERVKLLDVLDMNEETSVKFLSRRKAHMDRMMELVEQSHDKIEQIENLVKKEADKQQLKNSVKEYLDLENKISKERTDFISSLSDILTDEQIAKLIVFERRFREEIRGIIFRERDKFKRMDDE